MGLTNFPNGMTSFGVPVLAGSAVCRLPEMVVRRSGQWTGWERGNESNQALQTLYQAVNKAVGRQ